MTALIIAPNAAQIAPAANPNYVKEARAKRDKLKKVTQDFEAEFITQMLKQVRKSMTGENGLFGNSPESKQYRDMVDEATAQNLSKSGGLGLAKSLFKSMQSVLPPDPDAMAREMLKIG